MTYEAPTVAMCEDLRARIDFETIVFGGRTKAIPCSIEWHWTSMADSICFDDTVMIHSVFHWALCNREKCIAGILTIGPWQQTQVKLIGPWNMEVDGNYVSRSSRWSSLILSQTLSN
eukprot:scaffold1194_cov127-Cylindrotheca_fusiformis.AAC.22